MGYFRHIEILGEDVGKDELNLYLIVTEKKLLKEVIFKGNKNLSKKEIEKKIKFDDIPAIDEEELKKYAIVIKRLYREKNYHHVEITTELIPDGNKATAIFHITENKPTLIKRVRFVGNYQFSGKKLRSFIFTREDWILGFMDKAGSYIPEAVEQDKLILENFYQSNGFLNAKVTDAQIEEIPNTNNVNVTFYIEEGDCYIVSEIRAPGNESLSEEQILAHLPIKVGQVYSKDKIRQSIEKLRLLWGEYGYIYSDIEPSIEPDDNNKTVRLAFLSELGNKVYLSRINIVGNEKTRDKVIRRQLVLVEGELLTTKKMEDSKLRIEQLGYFDQRDGVNWKINRINKNKADLDLLVKETKTGRLDAQIGFGGTAKDIQNPSESFRVGGSVGDTNLFGMGVAFSLSGQLSKQERELLINLTQPWMFDRPIYAAMDAAIKRSLYENFTFTKDEIEEKMAMGALSTGFVVKSMEDIKFILQGGIESIRYTTTPSVNTDIITNPVEQEEFQCILDRRFMQGVFGWVAGQVGKDVRNHPIHPSRGYQWLLILRSGIPAGTVGFFKIDFDTSWYTPLIGERDLVLALHGHFGAVTQFGEKIIPFRELYHVGGPSSVRGYLFGEIGPTWRGDSIGGKYALWVNAELVFPITPDFSIKGGVFYDGGSGWSTPDASKISRIRLRNNGFSYRHAVGLTLRILRPTPIKIDWGFKLDRRKGEPVSQVHLSMAHNF